MAPKCKANYIIKYSAGETDLPVLTSEGKVAIFYLLKGGSRVFAMQMLT